MPPHLKAQIDRELDRLEMVTEQIKAIEDELRHVIVAADTVTPVPRMLIELKGIGNCALDRVPVSSLRQSQAGGCLCWPRADALAEWIN